MAIDLVLGVRVGESLHELAGEANELALDWRELGGDRAREPEVALTHVGAQDTASVDGELEPRAPVIAGVGGAADQAVALQAGQRSGERLRLDVVGRGKLARAQRPAAVEVPEHAELLQGDSARPLGPETAGELHGGATKRAGGPSRLIVHIRTLSLYKTGEIVAYRQCL